MSAGTDTTARPSNRLRRRLAGLATAVLFAVPTLAVAAEWDRIRGAETILDGGIGDHWFLSVENDKAYVVDGDAGAVKGTVTLSMFTPAVRPHLDAGMIYSYGSFYTRTYYGERTDAVIFHDAQTLRAVDEVIIPSKSAGIGHAGMIGLVDDRFVGVWNITPAMSVSIVDVAERTFVGEISTPGCAAVYPVEGGFLSPCGDGAVQFIGLNDDGTEASRARSERFFDIETDPVFDFAVSDGEGGWLFTSLEGVVSRVRMDGGDVVVERVFDLFEGLDDAEGWRIGGSGPFAYNAELQLFFALLHEGGGQETFEDPGTEVWAYSLATGARRGYRLEAETEVRTLQVTNDADPLLVLTSTDHELLIHDARTGSWQRTVEEIGGKLQTLR